MINMKENFRIFLCGDVMTGRGIDQILDHPSKPQLYEPFVNDARDYIYLAEAANGKIIYPVTMDYIWGDALTVWQELQPNAKIINLETTITQSDHCWPDKGIHYRMHPDNIDVLTTAGIDVCTLSNNHILDWGYEGLTDTLTNLKNAGIKFAGAGKNIKKAMQPAIFELNFKKRVLVFSISMSSSGVPENWGATTHVPGVYCADLSEVSLRAIAKNIKQFKQPEDLIILSIHWGSNWGYQISDSFRSFAHKLIDHANVDVVFGHSSHHPRPIEMYHGKPILYGCGDFLNDYEGISGHEEYRDDLTLMYFLDFDATSLQFKNLILVPMQIINFRLHRVSKKDCEWLLQTLNQFCSFGLKFIMHDPKLIYAV